MNDVVYRESQFYDFSFIASIAYFGAREIEDFFPRLRRNIYDQYIPPAPERSTCCYII